MDQHQKYNDKINSVHPCFEPIACEPNAENGGIRFPVFPSQINSCLDWMETDGSLDFLENDFSSQESISQLEEESVQGLLMLQSPKTCNLDSFITGFSISENKSHWDTNKTGEQHLKDAENDLQTPKEACADNEAINLLLNLKMLRFKKRKVKTSRRPLFQICTSSKIFERRKSIEDKRSNKHATSEWKSITKQSSLLQPKTTPAFKVYNDPRNAKQSCKYAPARFERKASETCPERLEVDNTNFENYPGHYNMIN